MVNGPMFFFTFTWELSAARRALTPDGVAPLTEDTLRQLRQRPQQPYEDLASDVREFQPEVLFVLDRSLWMSNLNGVRRGAAPGPTDVRPSL